jgi:hypothetical protein
LPRFNAFLIGATGKSFSGERIRSWHRLCINPSNSTSGIEHDGHSTFCTT